MAFGIHEAYRENPGPVYFLDDATTERGIVFQPDVYGLAEYLAAGDRFVPRVLDVGCGWGEKLAAIHERHPTWQITGVDYGANIEHCRNSYSWGTWMEADLEGEWWASEIDADVTICSDVIEHLVDPTTLLAQLRLLPGLIVLSTPAREVQYDAGHNGPPMNLCHVREWTVEELHGYLTGAGFEILHHGLTRGSDQGWAMGTQLVVMR